MSRIDFNSCHNIGDVERLHREALPGKLLLEFDMTQLKWKDGVPYNDVSRMPIFGVYATENSVVFETEKVIGQRQLIAFRAGLMVVTDILRTGDIFWSPDDYKETDYTIDDVSEIDFDFDGLLRNSNELPASIEWPQYTHLTV